MRCDRATTLSTLTSFIRAFKQGDLRTLDRVFAPAGPTRYPVAPAPGRFGWYSTTAPGARLDAAAWNRRTLLPYFRGRVALHESLGLRRFHVGFDESRNVGQFNGQLVRRADDLRPSIYGYKGTSDCTAGRPLLVVWSMSGPVKP